MVPPINLPMSASGKRKRLCILPQLAGFGGPASFQARLVRGLGAQGIDVVHDLREKPYDAVLVIGGSRQLWGLWRARSQGIPILQRLNGMNWIHRVRRTGLRHFLRAERGNLLLTITRSRLADRVIYQSQFAQTWWERVHGLTETPAKIVHNGVDLDEFHPGGSGQPPGDRQRILLVEGALSGGYELGLEHAVQLSNRLAQKAEVPVELVVAGRVSSDVRQRMEGQTKASLSWAGLVPRERIPELDRSAHMLFSADLNPACPNSVIEALACGLPVVGFETGALPELVIGDAGRLVGYGGDPWSLDPPDFEGLTKAVEAVFADQKRFRSGARAQSERALGLERMVNGYLNALGWR